MTKIHIFHTIKYKLIIYSILLVLIPTIVIEIILVKYSVNLVKEEVKSSVSTQLREASRKIDLTLEVIEDSSMNLLLDDKLLNIFNEKISPGESYKDYEKMVYINNVLSSNVLMENSLENIYAYDKNDQYLFTSDRKGFFSQEDLEDINWGNWSNSDNGTLPWVLRQNPFSKSNDQYYLSAKKTIKNRNNNIVDFYLNVNERSIYNLLKNINIREEGHKFLLDDELNFISHGDLSLIGKNVEILGISKKDFIENQEGFIKCIDKNEYLVVFTTSNYLNWKYVALIPTEGIYVGVNKIIGLAIIISFIVLIVDIVGILMISNNIYNPIRKLKIAMELAGGGNFETVLNNTRKDEFGIVFRSYNVMVKRIQNLINEVYVENLLKKEAEMKVLHNQINPHFLYNTLDVLHWMVKANNVEDTCNIIFSLSNFYRLVLSEGKNIVKISEALSLIDHYLIIQKNSFRKNFTYCYEIENGIVDYNIPKLILQPIVENAIIHGFGKKKGYKEIKITGNIESKYIILRICDNGIGISKKKLDKIRYDLKLGIYNTRGNFALQNINQQIQSICGKECGLTIESQEHNGTCVYVKITKDIKDAQVERGIENEDV